MNAAGFWRGVGLAVLLSAAGGALFALFSPLLGSSLTLRSVLLLVAGACLLDLLMRNPRAAGRLLCAIGAVLLALLLLAFDPPLVIWWILPTAYLWLLRSLGRGATPLRAAADGVLTVVGLACALASLRHSGSVWLALWCWLLLQAIAGAITAPKHGQAPESDRFSHAFRSAEAALRNLQQPRSNH